MEVIRTLGEWVMAACFVRFAANKPQVDEVNRRSHWQKLLNLENAAWAAFGIADIFAELFFVAAGEKRWWWAVLRTYRAVNTFMAIAPCLAYSIVPRNTYAADYVYSLMLLLNISFSGMRVLHDTGCMREGVGQLSKYLLWEDALIWITMQHFHYTHRACVMVTIFFRNHVSDAGHSPPDLFMALSVFRPLAQRWQVLCKSLFIFLLCWAPALGTLYFDRYLARLNMKSMPSWAINETVPHANMGPTGTLVNLAMDVLLLTSIVRTYAKHDLCRRSSQWESSIVMFSGSLGILFFLALCVDSKEAINLELTFTILSFRAVTHLACIIFSADTFSHRLLVPPKKRWCWVPLLYCISQMVRYVLIEFWYSSEEYAEEHQNHDHDSNEARVVHSIEHVGHFCMVECYLIQSIGWAVHVLEADEEHEDHAAHELYDDQRVHQEGAEEGVMTAHCLHMRLSKWRQSRHTAWIDLRQSVDMDSFEMTSVEMAQVPISQSCAQRSSNGQINSDSEN